MDSKRCLDLVVDFLNEEFDSFQCFLEEQDIESTEAEGIIDNIVSGHLPADLKH